MKRFPAFESRGQIIAYACIAGQPVQVKREGRVLIRVKGEMPLIRTAALYKRRY